MTNEKQAQKWLHMISLRWSSTYESLQCSTPEVEPSSYAAHGQLRQPLLGILSLPVPCHEKVM